MAICVHDVVKLHDIRVVHLLKEGYLTNSGAGNTFIFGLEADLLESNNSAGMKQVAGLVDYTVGTWTSTTLVGGPRLLRTILVECWWDI